MQHHRPRRAVGPVLLFLSQALFRYSVTREAWVLRGVGNRFGPVLVRRRPPSPST